MLIARSNREAGAFSPRPSTVKPRLAGVSQLEAPASESPTTLPTLQVIEAAAQVVYREFQATPQYHWALLSQRLGTECWVKHENHTPVGAFKLRGGLTYFDQLKRRGALPDCVISATRGNHGQSVGWAARSNGVECSIVVPLGNSLEKNAAMRALGVKLIEHGTDFQESGSTLFHWQLKVVRIWCPAFIRIY
jgi:threonine dehydratase